MRSHPRTRTLCHIIPPHIARHMSERGDDRTRERALIALELSERIRGQRDILAVTAIPTPAGEKIRTIYDADNTRRLPGRKARAEGEPPVGDPAVDEAYKGLGATYDLLYEEYDRSSLDNNGLRLEATVHYDEDYNNAFWNGQQMVFGDGDGEYFNRFTASIDIIGHELAHGLIDYTAGLVYRDQAGALNESFADVFGSLVKQRTFGQSAEEADWLIGAALFTDEVDGEALRSMESPGTAYDDPVLGKDPQPGHMRDFVDTSRDNGGVHINSGIPNRAFCIAATEIGGNSWEDAGRIWYAALDRLSSNSQFDDAVNVTLAVAGELYGDDSRQRRAVEKGWREVGLQPSRRRPRRRKRRQPTTASAEMSAGDFDHRIEHVAEQLGKKLVEVIGREKASTTKHSRSRGKT